MSDPGFFSGDDDYARQRMAAALVSGGNFGGQQRQSDPFGSLGQALAMKAMQNRQMQNNYNNQPPPTANIPSCYDATVSHRVRRKCRRYALSPMEIRFGTMGGKFGNLVAERTKGKHKQLRASAIGASSSPVRRPRTLLNLTIATKATTSDRSVRRLISPFIIITACP